MSTSSTRRVTASFDTVNDETAWLTIEGGGKFDLSISGTWTGTITLNRRTPPSGTTLPVETYTANTERVGEFAGETQVQLFFTTDGSGTAVVELRVGQGKHR